MLVNLSHLSPLGIHALAVIITKWKITQWFETQTQERATDTLSHLLDFTQNNQTKLLSHWMADYALLMQNENAYFTLADCHAGLNGDEMYEMAKVVFESYDRLFYNEYTALQTRLLDSLKDASDPTDVFNRFANDMIAKHSTLLSELATDSQQYLFSEFW